GRARRGAGGGQHLRRLPGHPADAGHVQEEGPLTVDLASSALSWLSLACAVGALAVYAVMVSRQPRMVRLFNGLGLFLTGLALFQGPAILRETGPGTNVFLAILLLNLAVIAQAY